jgi:hypothetical protein
MNNIQVSYSLCIGIQGDEYSGVLLHMVAFKCNMQIYIDISLRLFAPGQLFDVPQKDD